MVEHAYHYFIKALKDFGFEEQLIPDFDRSNIKTQLKELIVLDPAVQYQSCYGF
jgi:hypothetical protein